MVLLKYPMHILARHRTGGIVEWEAGMCEVDNGSHTANCKVWFASILHWVGMCGDYFKRGRGEVGNGTFSDSSR